VGEETLRYDPSSQILARTVAGDRTLYDTTIPDGEWLMCARSAHRDERCSDNRTISDRARYLVQAHEFR